VAIGKHSRKPVGKTYLIPMLIQGSKMIPKQMLIIISKEAGS